MSDNMSVNNSIIPVNTNQPLDIRTLVNSYSDISLIPNPYIGMTITVKVDETNNGNMTDYKVKSLKSNELGMNNTVIDEIERLDKYVGIDEIKSQLDTITIVAPKTNDIEILQAFLNNLPNNITFKFPKYDYILNDVLVIKDKHNITINANDTSFTSVKHGYGCIELNNCTNVTWCGGIIIGKGDFPSNTFDGNTLKNEKEDYKGVWGFRRNGDSKSTQVYNDGYLGNCGIGLLVHQGCENIIIENIDSSKFNFSGICVGFRGNGDYGWGDSSNVIESKNITIKQCNCHDNFSSGILLCQVDGFEVSSNIVSNNGHPNATINDYNVDPGYGITCTGTWFHAKNGFIKK